MPKIVYNIVEHDGGWAYKLGDVFSETFPDKEAALAAAQAAAAEQQVGGPDEEIQYEDANYEWHEEHSDGGDRPQVEVAEE